MWICGTTAFAFAEASAADRGVSCAPKSAAAVVLRRSDLIKTAMGNERKKRVSNWHFVTSGTTFLCVEVNQKLLRKRATLKLSTPFPNENGRFIHQLENQLFWGLHCGGFNLSLTRLNQVQKKGTNSTFERNLDVTLTPRSTSLPSQNCHSLCAFSPFWEQRGIAGGQMIKLQ